MKNPKEIGQILKEARQKKGLSAEEVYKATRIQPSLMDLFEQGRADEILSRVYVLSFLKKYAFFLDLDASALAADYKKFYTDEEKLVLVLDGQTPAIGAQAQKWMAFAVIAGIALLFVFFIVFLGVRLRSVHPRREPASLAAPKQVPLFPIPEEKPIDLTLESTGEVWMKVKKDGKTVFEGTLQKKEKKNWSAQNEIELWVGKAEALTFTINGRPLGKVGKGRIRNIRISRRGLKVEHKWLLEAR
ncbi:MAG: RodZ domain-containing protein [Candidatus Omnitrophota bacterium]